MSEHIESHLLQHSRLMVRVWVAGLAPLFGRWASDNARAVYNRGLSRVEREAPAAIDTGLLEEINRLPEAEYDDSHHRDFFVMMALGVLSFAVALHETREAAAMRDLRSQIRQLSNALGIGDLPAEIENLIARGAMADEPHLARDAESISAHAASRVDAALEPTARKYGWPPDRIWPRT